MRIVGLVVALALCATAGCAAEEDPVAIEPPAVSVPGSAPDDPPTTVVEPPVAPAPLVRWRGPVDALFVHPLVLRPRLAFHAPDARGFLDYFVTARELRVLLEELWRNGWTLVDVHDAAAGTVRVPAGRKPLVLYEDDANYYRYFRGHGLARRLVLDHAEDRVRAQLPDGRLSDADVVPMVEAAVARHPELSADGAKGVLALTAFEGLLGERAPDRPAAHRRLVALAERLRADGWTFASHTYGHIDLSAAPAGLVREDAAKWRAIAGPLGPVDVLVYPYGARPSRAVARELVDLGFPIQVDIDVRPTRRHVGGAVVMSRRHVDGLAFDVPSRQRPFYDVRRVRDPRRP